MRPYFPTYLPIDETYFFYYKISYQSGNQILTQLRFIHPQLSNNMHPVDGALVGAGSLWPVIYIENKYLMCFDNQDCPGWYPEGVWCPFMMPGTLWSGTPSPPSVLTIMPRLSRVVTGGGLVLISDTRNTGVWHPFSLSVRRMHAEIDEVDNRRCLVPISDTRNTRVWHPFSPLQSLGRMQRLTKLITGGVWCPFMIPGTLWSGTPSPLQSWWCMQRWTKLITGGGLCPFLIPRTLGSGTPPPLESRRWRQDCRGWYPGWGVFVPISNTRNTLLWYAVSPQWLHDDGDDEDDDDGNWCSLLVQETNKTSASSGARVSCGIYERTIHALTASTSLPKSGITPLKKKPNKWPQQQQQQQQQ